MRLSSSRPSIRITPMTGRCVARIADHGTETVVQRPVWLLSARRMRQARTMSDERRAAAITGGVQACCQM